MKAVTAVLAGGAARAPDPDALIREARRRQRRRRLAAMAVIAVAAGGAYGAVALLGPGGGRPARHPRSVPERPPSAQLPAVPPIPPSVRATVLIWTYPHATWLEQPGSNGFRRSWKPDLAVGDYQPALTRVGRWLVYVGNGTSAIRDDLSSRPRKLWTRVHGQPGPFAPAAQPGHVWLVFNYHHLKPRRPERARLVSVPAGRPGRAVTIPHGYLLVSGTDRGLLLSGTRGGLDLWKPGSPPRPLPYSRNDGSTDGLGATAQLVAYGAAGEYLLNTAIAGGSLATASRAVRISRRAGIECQFGALLSSSGRVVTCPVMKRVKPSESDYSRAIAPEGFAEFSSRTGQLIRHVNQSTARGDRPFVLWVSSSGDAFIASLNFPRPPVIILGASGVTDIPWPAPIAIGQSPFSLPAW